MRNNITAIKSEYLSPEIILNNAMAIAPGAKACYIVLIDKDNEGEVFSCGSVQQLCYASQVLNTITQRYLRGEIQES